MIRTDSQAVSGSVHQAIVSADSQNNRKPLFRRPSSADIHAHPRGEQNHSLSHAPNKAINFAKQVITAGAQAHFAQGSNTTDKAGVVGANVRSFLETTQKLGLTGLKSTKAAFKLKSGSWDVPAKGFDGAYRGMLGVSAATAGLSFIKEAATGAWQAVKDISHHSQRKHTQALLNQYDPTTRSLNGNPADVDELKRSDGQKRFRFITQQRSGGCRSPCSCQKPAGQRCCCCRQLHSSGRRFQCHNSQSCAGRRHCGCSRFNGSFGNKNRYPGCCP